MPYSKRRRRFNDRCINLKGCTRRHLIQSDIGGLNGNTVISVSIFKSTGHLPGKEILRRLEGLNIFITVGSRNRDDKIIIFFRSNPEPGVRVIGDSIKWIPCIVCSIHPNANRNTGVQNNRLIDRLGISCQIDRLQLEVILKVRKSRGENIPRPLCADGSQVLLSRNGQDDFIAWITRTDKFNAAGVR